MFVRFSTVAGSKGSADLARDVRGFAVKFYTQEGNWDLVGNNIPVFFIQDAIKFPDLIHAAKPEPDRGFPQAQTAHDNFWDFISLMPESMHMVMWIMSDRAIPRSFRFMEGFGVHTFRLVNADGEATFVKFHWKPKLGMQSVVWDEAVKINGADPDFHRRDLWNAIDAGDFREWELGVQLFDDEFADSFDFDVLDATKLIPEEVIPIRIGRPHGARSERRQLLRRDRAGRLLHARTSCRASTSPTIRCCRAATSRTSTRSSSVSGRRTSPSIPVNAPTVPVAHFQQDGHMAMTQPGGPGELRAELVGSEGGPREDPEVGYRVVRRGDGSGDKRRIRPESLRRPLQPGAPVLPEPDRGRAAAHRRRARVRAVEGRDADDPDSCRRPAAQHRRGPRSGRSPTGSGMPSCPIGSRRQRRPATI